MYMIQHMKMYKNGETTKQINDFALVLINVVKFHNEKIVCSGSFQ